MATSSRSTSPSRRTATSATTPSPCPWAPSRPASPSCSRSPRRPSRSASGRRRSAIASATFPTPSRPTSRRAASASCATLVGHGVGRTMHEEPQIPNFGRRGTGEKIKPGMTLAIEPMVNLGAYQVKTLADGWTVVTADGLPSAHFEHTVLTTEKGPEILTIPRPLPSSVLRASTRSHPFSTRNSNRLLFSHATSARCRHSSEKENRRIPSATSTASARPGPTRRQGRRP